MLVYEVVCACGYEFLKTYENFLDVSERRSVWNCSYYKYTDYKFSAAFFIFMVLMWNVYYYHEMLVDIGREENYKRLVAYGFHSWQINWYLTPRGEKLFVKTSIAYRLLSICSWFSFGSSSN